jgi:iron complex outermembrane receptor protein
MRLLGFGAVLVSMASAAAADSPVVTAERRPEPVDRVAGAVSLFTPRLMDDLGQALLPGLVETVPTMAGGREAGLGSVNSLFLRGLGSSDSLSVSQAPLGQFVDEVRLSGRAAGDFARFDVARVEVLRGPQTVPWGWNTAAGVVHTVLSPPSERFGGFVEGGYGSYDHKLVRGSVNLPVASMLQVKLSGFYEDDDGRASNSTTGERTNDADRAGLRLAARLRPAADLTWDVALSYLEANGENLPDFDCDPADASRCRGRFVTTGLSTQRRLGGVPQYDLPVSGAKADFALGNRSATTLVTSRLEWAGERVQLKLISGFSDSSERSALDLADGRGVPDLATPVPPVRGFRNGGFTTLTDAAVEAVSQEVLLSGTFAEGRVGWMAGGLWRREQGTADVADLLTAEDGTAAGVPRLLADRVLRTESETRAGHAALDVRPIEALRLSAGVRYTDETRTLGVRDNRAGCAAGGPGCFGAMPTAGNGAAIPTRISEGRWTPRVAVDWQVADAILLYASATEGVRSGGWNLRATTPEALLPYSGSSGWAWEAGARTSWLDGRLTVALTGFLSELSDVAVDSSTVGADGRLVMETRTGADWRNRGLELEVAATPLEGMNLFLNLGWQDARYAVGEATGVDGFGVPTVRQQQLDCQAELGAGLLPLGMGVDRAASCARGIVTATGEIASPARAPDVTLAAGGSWDIPVLTAGIVMTPSATLLYRSSMETGASNLTLFEGAVTAGSGTIYAANPFDGSVISGSRSGARWLLNAGFAIRTDDDAWLMVVECANCLDRTVADASLGTLTYLAPPRTWMLRARRQF